MKLPLSFALRPMNYGRGLFLVGPGWGITSRERPCMVRRNGISHDLSTLSEGSMP